MNKRKVMAGFFVSLLLTAAAAVLYVPNKAKSENYGTVPTVFVHGYKGSFNSFGKMLDRFENGYGWGKKTYVYYVRADGSLHEMKAGKSKGKPGFIQVVFQNNRASFAETASGLSKVLYHLKQNHQIDAVNLVGHSMGGIVSLKYSMEYAESAYPSVHKLILIGSPVAGIFDEGYFIFNRDEGAKDLIPGSAALRSIYSRPFPKGIKVLSIASTGDRIAVPESAAFISKIVPGRQLKELVLEDEMLGHSALHESEKVDRLIHRFLWQNSVYSN